MPMDKKRRANPAENSEFECNPKWDFYDVIPSTFGRYLKIVAFVFSKRKNPSKKTKKNSNDIEVESYMENRINRRFNWNWRDELIE